MNAYLKEVHEVVENKQNSLSPPNFELWKESLDKVEKTLLGAFIHGKTKKETLKSN